VLGDALANDATTLESHLAHQLGLPGAGSALDHVDIAAVAVDDLATVTARGAETNLGSFDDADLKAVLEQEQCGGQAGVTGADDADIGLSLALQGRAQRNGVG